MIERLLRTTFTFLFIVLGVVIARQVEPFVHSYFDASFWAMGVLGTPFISILFILGGAIIGLVFGLFASTYLLHLLFSFAAWGERTVTRISVLDLLLGVIGLLLGLIIANLLGIAFSGLPLIGPYISIVLSIICGYTGMHLAISQRDNLTSIYHNLRLSKDRELKANEVRYGNLLDTSVIIDGRIADIAQTGFLEGPLVVPVFVLEELQHIADSADVLKRNRGRRGLDILNELRKKKIVEIKIVTEDFDDVSEVDSKLIKLGLLHEASIITNDYNLNKVAELQGIEVLNINDLANAVKPVVIPGEEMIIQIVKTGKEPGQGVGYLADGTMVVVEGANDQIGKDISVVVTSVLQTSAGKMIFADFDKE